MGGKAMHFSLIKTFYCKKEQFCIFHLMFVFALDNESLACQRRNVAWG